MTTRIQIDLGDVRRAGSVSAAVAAACPDSVMLADSSAMGGQTFATSGPGPGWSKTFDVDDYAAAAIREDVAASGSDPSDCEALDPVTGRIATGTDDTDEDGEWDGSVEWSDESRVQVLVPDLDDAIEYPDIAAMMVQSVIDHHGAESDRAGWVQLVQSVRDAAEALEDIDLDDLAD